MTDAAFEKQFSKTATAEDKSGPVSDAPGDSMGALRGRQTGGIQQVADFANEGTYYGGYDPASATIETSTEPPPAIYNAKPDKPPPAPKKSASKKASGGASASTSTTTTTKKKSEAALRKFHCERKVKLYTRHFKEFDLDMPPLPSDPEEAAKTLEDECAAQTAGSMGDMTIIMSLAPVEAVISKAPLFRRLNSIIRIEGYTQRFKRHMEQNEGLRRDLNELYIRYGLRVVSTVEARLLLHMVNILKENAAENAMGVGGYREADADISTEDASNIFSEP